MREYLIALLETYPDDLRLAVTGYEDGIDDLIPCTGSPDFNFRCPTERRYRTAPKRIANPDDTLVSVIAPVGAINMAWERCCIGRILGALDDKIELNRRINATLESIARALYRSWFIDFDPVRAKISGRWHPGKSLPGMPALLYHAFPARLASTEAGDAPAGWKVGQISDIADIFSGKRPPARHLKSSPEASIPLWGGNGPMAFVSEPLIDYPILLTGRVGTLGSVFRVSTPCWPSDNTLILKPKHDVHFEYLFFSLQQIDFRNLNRGSTQPLVTQTDLKSQLITLPDINILDHFHNCCYSIFERIDHSENETRTLAAQCDALLPELVVEGVGYTNS